MITHESPLLHVLILIAYIFPKRIGLVHLGPVVLAEQSSDTSLPTGPQLTHSLAVFGGGTFCLSNPL